MALAACGVLFIMVFVELRADVASLPLRAVTGQLLPQEGVAPPMLRGGPASSLAPPSLLRAGVAPPLPWVDVALPSLLRDGAAPSSPRVCIALSPPWVGAPLSTPQLC
ncbi:hypothetical protein ACP70R_008160 [Stipagrostis hirtigluma subsp. patula]